jgi:hypothetical protein
VGDVSGRPRLKGQPSSRTGENPPYGMIGGIEETSASFEARSAPRSYPTDLHRPRAVGSRQDAEHPKNPSRSAANSTVKKLIPVKLPPGRARLTTRPSLTGSSPTSKTIGIVVVAALAANAELLPSTAAITATRRRTNSAASAGS